MATKLVNATAPRVMTTSTGKEVVIAYKTVYDTGKDYRGKLGAKDRARKNKHDTMHGVPATASEVEAPVGQAEGAEDTPSNAGGNGPRGARGRP